MIKLGSKEGVSVPRIFARFEKGRIEEWIESKVLLVSELPDKVVQISKMLSHFHATQIEELSKEPRIIIEMDKWVRKIKKHNYFKEPFICLETEVNFIKEKIISVNSPIVFSHNDLQENNILHNPDTQELYFIDFEYSKYNFRGFDFGNHFCEWAIEYNSEFEHGYEIKLENYPTKEQQMTFFWHYLNENLLHNQTCPSEQDIESLLKEAQCFTLVSHIFWGLWGIIQHQQSNINFNYHLYAVERLQLFLSQKNLFYSS